VRPGVLNERFGSHRNEGLLRFSGSCEPLLFTAKFRTALLAAFALLDAITARLKFPVASQTFDPPLC
jgi:hypothetical protein